VRAVFSFEGEADEVRIRGSLEALGGSELSRRDGVWSTEVGIPDDVRAV